MTDQEFERIIEKSVRTYGNDYFDLTAPSHDFSDTFQRKMNRLLSDRQKKHRTIRRIAAAAAVVAAACICVAVVRVNILSNQAELSDAAHSTITATAEQSASSAADESDDNSTPVKDNALPEQQNAAKSIQDTTPPAELNGDKADTAMQTDSSPENLSPDDSITTSSACATLTRYGKSVSLTPEQAAAVSDIVVSWIVNHTLQPDTTQSAVLPAPDQTAYYISVNSTDSTPLLYDESNNPVFQLTITLDNDTGCICYENTQQVFPFHLDQPEQKYRIIENLISG